MCTEVRLLVRVVSIPSLLKQSMSFPMVLRLQPMYSASSTSEAAACPTSKAISTPLIWRTAFVRTAAVISPVGLINDHGKEIRIPSGMDEMGPVLTKLYKTLRGIQMGEIEGPEGWIHEVK